MKIKITSDSTCDLSPEQIKEHDIGIIPLFINKGGKIYRDCVDIFPDEIYEFVDNGGPITTTAAVNIADYTEFLKPFASQYDAVIHINISSDFSSCHQNACLAAQEFDNVYAVDSRNLSTGHGHVVMAAAEMAESGMGAEEIIEKLKSFIPRVRASFILERLDYMRKGGRCSAVTALGANILKLRPCIEVVDGKMGVGKKYRGDYLKCVREYVTDKIKDKTNIDQHRIFITHSGAVPEVPAIAREIIQQYQDFDEIVETRAGCTVSSHCGFNTIGVLFIEKE